MSDCSTASASSSVSVPAMKEDFWDWLYEKIVGKGQAMSRHHEKKLLRHYAKHMPELGASRPSSSGSSAASTPRAESLIDDCAISDSPTDSIFPPHLIIAEEEIDEGYYSVFAEQPVLTRDVIITPRDIPGRRHYRPRRRYPIYGPGAETWLNRASSSTTAAAPSASKAAATTTSKAAAPSDKSHPKGIDIPVKRNTGRLTIDEHGGIRIGGQD